MERRRKNVDARLRELGVVLPKLKPPGGTYAPVRSVTAPELPSVAWPLLKDSNPLTPEAPAWALLILKASIKKWRTSPKISLKRRLRSKQKKAASWPSQLILKNKKSFKMLQNSISVRKLVFFACKTDFLQFFFIFFRF